MSNQDNPHSRGVSNDPHMGSFSATNMFVTIRGQAHRVPLNTLVLPFLVTKVNLQTTTTAPPVATGNPDGGYPNFPILYDEIEGDQFNMYNTLTGEFTIPTAGWWRITYATTMMFNFVTSRGPITIEGYVEKTSGTLARHLLSVAELAIMRKTGPTSDVHDSEGISSQEIRTVSNSGIVFFNAGDIFMINGRMTSHTGDITDTTFEIGNKILGNPGLTTLTDPPAIDLLTGFHSATTCEIEFVRPVNFLT